MTILLWSLFFVVGIGFFGYQIRGRWINLTKARRDDGRNYDPKTWGIRLKNTLIYAFGQKKFFLGDQPSGMMHFVIFWGFMILSLQVITMFMRGWFPEFLLPGFSMELLGGPYGLLKDFFEVLVILGVSVALFRWTIQKPTRLMGFLPAESRLRQHSHWEAIVILSFIFTIMVSGLFYDAGRIVYLSQEGSGWQPVSRFLSGLFQGNTQAAEEVSTLCWWLHNTVILVFLNLLPRSKHFHIITAIPNVFLGKVEPKGRLAKKDYSADGAIFGRSQIDQFTWKQMMDMYSCTECGRCSSQCPANKTGKMLAPRQLLLNLRDALYANQELLAKKTGTDSAGFEVIVGEENKPVLDEVIWSCVACRACEEACPVNIEYVDKIVEIRQHLVQEASRFPSELNRAFKGLETNSNPWGISSAERAGWAEGFDVPLISEKKDVEYLYYVGCGGSFDSNNKKTTQSFVKLLKKANLSFAILGIDETCNGETARRLGNEYLFQTMAEQLVSKFKEYSVKKVIVNCPHCFNTLKNEYPDFGGEWEIIHAAALVSKLVADGKLKLDGEFSKKVVYHDSCYYGRFNDVYDEPRNLIKNVPGTQLDEINPCRHKGMCCGAGGGRMWMEEPKDKRVNVMRTEQALEQNPDVIATSCPFCKIMIGSAINEKGIGDKVAVMDVMEIVEGSAASALRTE
jgi:Fe-S oxidoreductase